MNAKYIELIVADINKLYALPSIYYHGIIV